MSKETIRKPAPCHIVERASSSLDIAHELVSRGELPVWGSVLVLEQTAGRGQLRRVWASPPGNCYATLRLPLEPPFTGLEAAPALGLLLAEALGRMGFTVKSKWPNDLLQCFASSWHKVGGILLEERAGALVAGIGINVAWAPPESELREHHAFPAGVLAGKKGVALTERAPGYTMNLEHESVPAFWEQLANTLFSCYFRSINLEAQSAWLSLVPANLAFLGQRVCVRDFSGESVFGDNIAAIRPEQSAACYGILEGLGPDGALVLSTESGRVTFLGGSLTLDDKADDAFHS